MEPINYLIKCPFSNENLKNSLIKNQVDVNKHPRAVLCTEGKWFEQVLPGDEIEKDFIAFNNLQSITSSKPFQPVSRVYWQNPELFTNGKIVYQKVIYPPMFRPIQSK